MILKITFSTWTSSEEESQSLHCGLLVQPDHCLIQGVLVLVQPASNIVVHCSRIVNEGEVGLSLALGRFGFLEVVGLSKMLFIKLVLEGGVCGLGEHALLFQDGEDAQWLNSEKQTLVSVCLVSKGIVAVI